MYFSQDYWVQNQLPKKTVGAAAPTLTGPCISEIHRVRSDPEDHIDIKMTLSKAPVLKPYVLQIFGCEFGE